MKFLSDLLAAIRYDLRFIKSHTLQPKGYKVLKIFILLGFLVGYVLLFSWVKMLVFLGVFISLALVVHFTYRIKTHKFTTTWMDFVVTEENGVRTYKPIGKLYYSAVLLSAVIAILVSLLINP